jgi:hypothetical protein
MCFHGMVLIQDNLAIDRVWIGNQIYWTNTAHDYTSQISITEGLVFSASLHLSAW